MDPISIITVCVQVSRVLHSTIETYKNCPDELVSLLTSTEGLLIQLRRLDAVKVGLANHHRQYLQEVCGDAWEIQCRQTVEELNTLIRKIQELGRTNANTSRQVIPLQGQPDSKNSTSGHLSATPSFLGKLAWILKKDDAIKLSQKLNEHQEVIFRALCTITMETSVQIESNTNILLGHNVTLMAEMQNLRRELMESTKAVLAFRAPLVQPPPTDIPLLATAQDLYQQGLSQLSPVLAYQTWYGATREIPPVSQHTATYSESRHLFSDLSYYHDWNQLFLDMEQARSQFKQDWINCIRRVPVNETNVPSGYTPLHQAAWRGSSVEVVKNLLRLGAWRTLKTIRDKDHTPLEIAKTFRHTHLYDILAPVIRHPLPAQALITLENALHELIEHEICAAGLFDVASSAIRYPELSVLTEMVFPMIFFPVNEEAENMTESQGFFIRLDDRELVVRSCYDDRKFRISPDGCVTRIEEAFVIGQLIELQTEG